MSLLAIGIATVAWAEWAPNGTPAGHNFTVVTTDGAGGAFIGSIGSRLPTLQHLTESGDPAAGWPSQGIAPRVRAGLGYSGDEDVRVTPDGTGGAYVSMQVNEVCTHSCAGDSRQVRVIRVLASGQLADGWPAGGLPVGWVHRLGLPALVPNGDHGVLVCWLEAYSFQMRIQSLDSFGRRLWSDEGVAIPSTARAYRSLPTVVSDGSGGALVIWMEGADGNARVIAQHVSSSGRVLWAENQVVSDGYEIGVEDHWYRYWQAPIAIADGAGGAIIAWSGRRAGSSTGFDVYAARLTHGGTLPWKADVAVSSADNDQTSPRLVAGRGGQTLIAWHDCRDPSRESFFVQSLNRGGRGKWASNGIPFCSAPGTRDGLAAIEDGDGGAFFAWHDSRPGGMVYATRLTSEGNTSLNWPENGSAVCAHFVDGTVNENRPSAIAYNLGLATTGDGNAILAWSDSRNRCGYDNDPCSNRTFAMRLLSDGPATSPTAAAATEAPMIDGASNPDGARAVASTDLALLGSRPLSGGGCEIRFSLATPEPARLDVFDLAGRRLLTRDLGAFGPGVHSTTVRSSELSRGVFFVRLAQGERRTNSRIVLTN